MRKRGYKKVKIEDNNQSTFNNRNTLLSSLMENKMIKFTLIIIILILFFSFISYYLIYKKYSNTNEIIKIKATKPNNIENIEISDIKDLNEKSKILTEKVKNYEKTLRKITEAEINDFREMNSMGILYDRTKYKRSETPDISIVTTLRNQAHCIHKAIRSVQNQSLKNLEMIIVDDCSLDNSIEIVENFMKEDDRIILVKHNINEGIMITRNEAIRMAKGKYIAVLDADDTFIHKDILLYSLNAATLADLDVLEFYSAYYYNHQFKGYYHYHGDFPIIYQPELRTKLFEFKEEGNIRAIKCRTVWGKIVKNEIFQKTLENIPDKYLYDFILGFEDTMITFSLYQVAQSYYTLHQPGYYYTLDEKRNEIKVYNNRKCTKKEGIIEGYDHIKFLQYLVDKLDDNKFGKQVLYHELKAINNYTYSNFKRTIKDHFNWTYNIFDYLNHFSIFTQIINIIILYSKNIFFNGVKLKLF